MRDKITKLLFVLAAIGMTLSHSPAVAQESTINHEGIAVELAWEADAYQEAMQLTTPTTEGAWSDLPSPGAVTNLPAVEGDEGESLASESSSDVSTAQTWIYYEYFLLPGYCFWYCTRIPYFCDCLEIIF